ncbi:MAG: T9SS type A sorting domain-containing protein, partial [Bacteroidota bacterium]
ILDMGSPKVEYASCHGTAEVVMDETGLIFPNPATEKLFLKSRWSQSGNIRVSIPVHVSIFTEAGKQVLSRKLTAPPGVLTEIDVSYLPEALYFIRVAYDQSVGGYEPIWATILVRKE